MRVPLPALLGGSALLLLLLRWRRRRALWRKVAEAQERQELSLVRMEAAARRFREQVSAGPAPFPRGTAPGPPPRRLPRGFLTWVPSPSPAPGVPHLSPFPIACSGGSASGTPPRRLPRAALPPCEGRLLARLAGALPAPCMDPWGFSVVIIIFAFKSVCVCSPQHRSDGEREITRYPDSSHGQREISRYPDSSHGQRGGGNPCREARRGRGERLRLVGRLQEEATGDVLSAEAKVQLRGRAGMRCSPAVPASG